MVTYSLKLEPQIEGGYTVTVPVLPSCISEGENWQEALRKISDAIKGYLQVLTKHNRRIPLAVSAFSQVEVFRTRNRTKAKMPAHA